MTSPNWWRARPTSLSPYAGTASSSISSRLSPSAVARASSAPSSSFAVFLYVTRVASRASSARADSLSMRARAITPALATLGLRGPSPATFLSEVSTSTPSARAVSGWGGRRESSQASPRRASAL